MNKWNIALGFYQNHSTAKIAIHDLKRHGFWRIASFYHLKDKGLQVEGLLGSHVFGIKSQVIDQLKKCVFVDEVLVVVQVKSHRIKDTMSILRQVKAGHPITFLLSLEREPKLGNKLAIPEAPELIEQSRQTAINLAKSTEKTIKDRSSHTVLLKDLKNIENSVYALSQEIAKAEYTEQTSPLAAEWFLDNIPVIQGSIEEVYRNLSRNFYRTLPKVYFQSKHLPRIYAIASEIVHSTAGKINKENITDFIQSYQTICPLTIGELWALPLMLKFCLLEWVQFLAGHIARRMRTGELANFWGNRLLHASQRVPAQLPTLMSTLAKEIPLPTPHFAEELIDHLFDEEAALNLTKKWLETRFKHSLNEVFHKEQIDQSLEQLIFSSAVKSLITLAQFSWQDIVEELSVVDAILKEDPEGVYSQMDFNSRNSYREVIEQMRNCSRFSEVEIARKCLSLAREGTTDVTGHVGYYLIDKGRSILEHSLDYAMPIKQMLQNGVKSYAELFYLGTILISTLATTALLFLYGIASSQSIPIMAFLSILAIIPISEIVIQVLNFLLVRFLEPSILPKMDYKEEIPEKYKTLVVVPMMLTSADGIRGEVNRLEIRYLANSDDALLFGLFSDFKDAPQQHLEEDQGLIDLAIREIQNLEQKYGPGKFFLFHRQRVWSNSENAWIGWERKRGKLECLNRYLMGEPISENIIYHGRSDALKGICYIITLDSDTQLPKNQGKKLIEILSHPLNRPVLNKGGKSLERGYTIIQPTVCTDFPHTKNSLFLQIFSDPSVIDPYTHAISNVSQDLTGEAAYHGKGIYDLKTFHSILTGRYPTEHILSHDLIEGSYVRVGFTAAVCLFDLFPEDYLGYTNRQRRWLRGDWQIIDWLYPSTPLENGEKEKNPLSSMNRWKIFDNLRRSLLPVSLMALLVSAWLLANHPSGWTLVVAIVLIFSPLLQLIAHLFRWTSYLTILSWHEVKLGFERALISIAVLPQEAYFSLDSIGRVFYRRLISHRQLLEWTASRLVNHSAEKAHRLFLWKLTGGSVFSVILLITIASLNSSALALALPFSILWILAPLIIKYIDKSRDRKGIKELSGKDVKFLRNIARRTWRYFDDFVGPDMNWFPPDNYQTALNIELAPRTSPTNIGLGLIAVLNAYDLKYITCDQAIDKLTATINNLDKLERFEGHFLNWYDIKTLKPLYPRYISTVDSGNLLASLWTVQQGLFELGTSPIISFPALEGIQDTYHVFFNEKENFQENPESISELESVLANSSSDIYSFIETINRLYVIIQRKNISYENDTGKFNYWLKSLEKELGAWEAIISRYFKWVPILKALSDEDYRLINLHANTWRDIALMRDFSLKMLADGDLLNALNPLIEAAHKRELPPHIKVWSAELLEALTTAQWLAGEKLAEINRIMAEIDCLSDSMNLSYLYNPDRKLFSIGYNVDDRRLDQSYYDLLASEARLASLVAIAKNDAPLEHWWSLGRPYGLVKGKHVLLSWGGTMFEYLMPVLFNKHYPDSLLGDASEAAVDCQMAYGKARGIPWGISEAAYSAIDAHKIYQYRSFGVPGLGLKRGLEKDLVVSPYSTLLALAINPRAAIENLRRLAERKISLKGLYGYYESIDFTREADSEGSRGVVVFAYMAHHQGMALTAINNLLNDDKITKRFHGDPRISGVESLLFERLPLSPSVAIKGFHKDRSSTKLKPFSTVPIMGISETPNTAMPKINILSNHTYSVVISNAGGGYSRWRDIDITRWRSDTTCDPWGSFYYIKDLHSRQAWSSTYQPLLKEGSEYSSSFKADKVEFRRKDEGIETVTEIVVSTEDDAEIRSLTFINKSDRLRELEITSYQELVLAPHAADRSHPAFNKLFIETESMPELNGLIAFRRLRSPDDREIWCAHLLALDPNLNKNIQFETSRALFIGRGRSLYDPISLERDLTNTAGTVLDPIFSLRYRFSFAPGTTVKVSFVTLIADNRPQLLNMMEKYQELSTSHRAFEMAWTYSQLELRHLSITVEDVQLYQKLASRILYPHSQLRASLDRLENNKLGQSHLWSYGISGDLPLIVVSVDDLYDVTLVKQVLIAQTFWRLRGLKVDLLIINEEEIGYENLLQEQILRLIQAYAFRDEANAVGGVHVKNISQIPEQELTLILSVASVFLIATRGSLRQQLVSPMPATHYPPKFVSSMKREEEASPALPFLELPFFNGLGGYSPDGKMYAIYLGPDTHTPAPWINVLANPKFGTLVTETGSGTTWYGNSQSNRITPWSNDPIVNPLSDAIYIRDEESGTFWTPTPGPIRELDAYRIRHGQGYSIFEHNSHGIEQELMILVPLDDEGGIPLRIQRLKLHNISSTPRTLTVTAYQDLVLGATKEETQMHVVTHWDSDNQALFAYNHYNPTFGNCVAFSTSLPAAASYTGDRTEFIGRNRLMSEPAALKRRSLSNHTGGGFDPCAALQVPIVLNPGATEEVMFILGYGSNEHAAKELIEQSCNREKVDQLLTSTQSWWNTFLDAVQVDVPDLLVNFAMNRWLPYQNLACRVWGRTAFYQSSGAYGFRDQLQDGMALVYSRPDLTRGHILTAAARQFIEGDVQHWWDPITGSGVRTRFSDDLLWLPFATAHYVRTTGDISILSEQIPFLIAPLLEPDQHEVFSIPEISSEKASLLDHCRRAIKKGSTAGPHGLPLMGGGDWNDGMNRVGIGGKGESVWLAWFLIHVLHDFVELLAKIGSEESVDQYVLAADRLAHVVESEGWDGEWYRRAYFDNGNPLGSKESIEANIDSLAQSWAVISGSGDSKRSQIALKSALERLVKVNERLVLLLIPPFDKTPDDPGYIKGYPPGVRENGGQYTHGSLWLAMAFARQGDGNSAVDLLKMMHPHSHTRSIEEVERYKGEPYAIPGDVYSLASEVGRGGWSWYTGSAAWMYRIWLEEILGFKLRGNTFRVDCAIPKEWDGFKLRYRYQTSLYEIKVENPQHISKGTAHIVLDNVPLEHRDIPLVNDGKTHTVHIVLK